MKHICRINYGDSLPEEERQPGAVAVFGSNGRVGDHRSPNTKAPCVVLGRKGSFGKVNFSAEPVFAIDTTFYVDERTTNTDVRWLSYLLGWLHPLAKRANGCRYQHPLGKTELLMRASRVMGCVAVNVA